MRKVYGMFNNAEARKPQVLTYELNGSFANQRLILDKRQKLIWIWSRVILSDE